MIITKATELFIQDLAGVNAINAKFHRRKTLQVADITAAALATDRFYFLKDSKLLNQPLIKSTILPGQETAMS